MHACQIWLLSDGRVEKKGGGYRQTHAHAHTQRDTAALYSRCQRHPNPRLKCQCNEQYCQRRVYARWNSQLYNHDTNPN